MKSRYIFILGAIALVIIAFAVVRPEAPADPVLPVTAAPHYNSGDVQVRITTQPMVSRGGSPMLVQLDSGVIPDGITHLMVLTDENCQPDADGISHCLNRVSFETSSGTTGEAALRHHHRMSEEPCLTPGQSIHLVT